jgi:hypothetical protein
MVAVGIIECWYVGNVVVSRDKTGPPLAFLINAATRSRAIQLAAIMTTATAMRARWAARNTSEGKSRLVIRHACHHALPVAIAMSINPEKEPPRHRRLQSCAGQPRPVEVQSSDVWR